MARRSIRPNPAKVTAERPAAASIPTEPGPIEPAPGSDRTEPEIPVEPFPLRIYRGPEETEDEQAVSAKPGPLSPGNRASQQDPIVNDKPVAAVLPVLPTVSAPAVATITSATITSATITSATSTPATSTPATSTPATSVPVPSAEYLANLKEQSEALESASPAEIIRWAVEKFAPKLTMATAFGPEGMAIIHMLAAIDRTVPIFNLDTGYQFEETLDLRKRVLEKYGIDIELRTPETTVAEYEQLHGGPLYGTNPDKCCFDRKLSTLHRSAIGMSAWMSGIRRDQSPDRARAPIVGWDKKFGLVKISPLANWTKKEVWNLITKEDVPYNPLHDQGYTSIGCKPCTRAVLFGEDERAGRWSGFEKKECGLHTSND